MSPTLVISPNHGNGWYVDVRDRHGERVGMPSREAAEEFARHYIDERCDGCGEVLVYDAYHRVIGHTRYRDPHGTADPAGRRVRRELDVPITDITVSQAGAEPSI